MPVRYSALTASAVPASATANHPFSEHSESVSERSAFFLRVATSLLAVT
jgi:hypothetical protein